MRRAPIASLAWALALLPIAKPAPPAHAAEPRAFTYSIVARDPATGDFGVAVQSHWFQVGPIVPWAEAGVGAVATQSLARVDYGPLGLALMRSGKSSREALDSLLATDEGRDVRQVAMVDRGGAVASWTGPKCIAEAGHHAGEGYSVQANLMDRDSVWPAMARAYEAATGDFASRLLAALEAAEAEGGDIRGRQSAALLVVRAESTGRPWEDRLVDLRVDDHPEPLAELRRLLDLHRAYVEMNRGDEAAAKSEWDAAVRHYSAAVALAPEVAEIPFWQAVTLFMAGQEERARDVLRDYEERVAGKGRVSAEAAAARCRGILDTNWRDAFEEALALHAEVPTPFERARTELCYAERLRRARKRSEARDRLRAAVAVFDELGAVPWAERARAELRASGEHARSRATPVDTLTQQELVVARLVVGGATNREAAATLFVSPKTIEFHLANAYRKLDVRSRTELVRTFAEQLA